MSNASQDEERASNTATHCPHLVKQSREPTRTLCVDQVIERDNTMNAKQLCTDRREFLARGVQAGIAFGAPMIVSAAALGREGPPPSERISMGGIGIGNRGTYDLKAFLANPNVHFRAICDVKAKARNAAKKLIDSTNGNADCEVYSDLRRLLDRKDIDAVLIATGPNWHTLAAALAAKAGKDVYCEKPCSKNISESIELANVIRRTGRVFQAGTQRRSVPNFAYAVHLARSGRLGKLHTVHSSVHRTGMVTQTSGWMSAQTEQPRDEVDWDLYLGPAAWRPYNKAQLNGFTFEKGGGLVGNGYLEWGAHCVDLCQWANNSDGTMPVEYLPPEMASRSHTMPTASSWFSDLTDGSPWAGVP